MACNRYSRLLMAAGQRGLFQGLPGHTGRLVSEHDFGVSAGRHSRQQLAYQMRAIVVFAEMRGNQVL